MDRDANYVAVGAFVLLVIAMAVAFVFWYTDQRDKHSYETYEIYFSGTVSGLSKGGPVRYLGVDVGRVRRILLDPDHGKRVLVIADIDTTAPLDSRTRATLSLQGVTGLLFIDLQQDPKVTVAGPLEQGRDYPIIRSAPSDFDVLLSNLPNLSTRAVELVDRLNKVFSDQNVSSVQKTLDNLRSSSDKLPATFQRAQDTLAEIQRAAVQIDGAAADLRTVTTTSARLDGLIVDNGPGISRFTTQALPEFERLLRESRAAARDIRELSRSLKEDPSQLLYQSNEHGLEVPQ